MVRVILEIIKVGVQQYGALFAVVGFVCFILWYLMKHVIRQAEVRETEQRQIITSQIRELKLHRRQARKFHQQEIGDHQKMSQGLDEIVKALGRINGYKK